MKRKKREVVEVTMRRENLSLEISVGGFYYMYVRIFGFLGNIQFSFVILDIFLSFNITNWNSFAMGHHSL